ncbi:MAG: 16S rRNA (cytosine(1402)-N(4))-methyltransferase RsmH [Bacteroidota bacterium]|jgi:16S rRNA (cytosine1402-N4)-methyltransferase
MSHLNHNAGNSGESKGEVYHVPVMLKEAVDGLSVISSGIYVDCTFGGGGHSREILRRLDANGRLIVFDQDPAAKANLPNDKRILFIPHNFRHLSRFLKLHHIDEVDGVLADLGVSSKQFDDAVRGFSTRFEGPLDMRMDPSQQKTAAEVIATYSHQQLHKMFEQYGEVTNAKTLAAAIVQQRMVSPFQTITQFKQSLQHVVKGNPHKYWAQVFQALRIEVNDELSALQELLEQLPAVLRSKGRAAIISFHSLEDRMVKNFFKKGTLHVEEEHPFSRETKPEIFRIVTKKPVEPTPSELISNPRSRSARLRIAEKI